MDNPSGPRGRLTISGVEIDADTTWDWTEDAEPVARRGAVQVKPIRDITFEVTPEPEAESLFVGQCDRCRCAIHAFTGCTAIVYAPGPDGVCKVHHWLCNPCAGEMQAWAERRQAEAARRN